MILRTDKLSSKYKLNFMWNWYQTLRAGTNERRNHSQFNDWFLTLSNVVCLKYTSHYYMQREKVKAFSCLFPVLFFMTFSISKLLFGWTLNASYIYAYIVMHILNPTNVKEAESRTQWFRDQPGLCSKNKILNQKKA